MCSGLAGLLKGHDFREILISTKQELCNLLYEMWRDY